MGRYRVECIRKRGSHFNPHERIEALGGQFPQSWYDTEEHVIGFIERRDHSFYTLVNGREAEVVVAVHERRKYLKTTADGYAPNNLLALRECP